MASTGSPKRLDIRKMEKDKREISFDFLDFFEVDFIKPAEMKKWKFKVNFATMLPIDKIKETSRRIQRWKDTNEYNNSKKAEWSKILYEVRTSRIDTTLRVEDDYKTGRDAIHVLDGKKFDFPVSLHDIACEEYGNDDIRYCRVTLIKLHGKLQNPPSAPPVDE
jgi:hypothetical protein